MRALLSGSESSRFRAASRAAGWTAVALGGLALVALAVQWSSAQVSTESFALGRIHAARRRLAYPEDALLAPPYENAENRGFVVLHFIGIIYAILAIQVIGDTYFVMALEILMNQSKMSPDLGGATVMALASEMPSLCVSFYGTLVGENDIGLDLVLGGTAIQAFLVAACGLLAAEAAKLTWFPLARDCTYLMVCLAALVGFLSDGSVQLWEGLVLVALYVGYVVVTKLSTRLELLLSNVKGPPLPSCLSSGKKAPEGTFATVRAVVPVLASERVRTQSAATGAYHFYMLKAEKLRDLSGPLPRFQELLGQPGWFGEVHIGVQDLKSGVLHKSVLSVSHRWHAKGRAFDPQGEKMAELQGFLRSHPDIEWVWIDWACLPQERWSEDSAELLEPRSELESALFKRTLPTVNYLYLGTRVLLIVDSSYLSRFWTQFEAFLSMQSISQEGVVPTGLFSTRSRTFCVACGLAKEVDGAKSSFKRIKQRWSNIPVEKAIARLSKDDVEVTNKSDKDVCLSKLRDLNAQLKKELEEVLRRKVIAYSSRTKYRSPVVGPAAESGNAVVCPEEPTEVVAQQEEVVEEEEEEDEYDILNPCRRPEGLVDFFWWALYLPINLPVYFLMPRPTEQVHRWLFSLVISGSIVAGLCFLVAWWADVAGTALGIPTAIFGGLILAPLKSYADISASIAVAKHGEVDMVLSSSFGTFIFSVGFCLGVPWSVKALVNSSSNMAVTLLSPAAAFYALVVLACLLLLFIALRVNKWKLSKAKAIFILPIYFVYVAATLVVGLSDPISARLFLG